VTAVADPVRLRSCVAGETLAEAIGEARRAAAITRWNFFLAIPAWKPWPALAYGSTVVWKSAELVPLTSVRLLEACRDAGLPTGVLELVLGRGSEVGEAIVSAPETAAISFTGSNAVGERLRP